MGLEERLKQRLLGGAVLVALVVIFVPMLIDEPIERRTVSDHTIPVKPAQKKATPVKRVQPLNVAKPQPEKITKSESTGTKPAKLKEVKPPEAKLPEAKPKPVAKNTSTRPSPTAWMIQVASLTNEKNAKKLVKELRKADLPAQMERVRLKGKQHYRIQVGPEVDHRLAEKMVAKIKKAFKLNPKLMRYPE
ncbi:SPOR domain-containing protein [Candidatus Thiodiazotropha sp. CDECU1]|uniref:SPOR domain-containing protein n=1 Tax=Candidatus Thiodiazotropha sp. CDECU1 TaxID=3065865 RepID=UPI00292CC538|nr:SPOR domain-containing protein [Candidatus Thiodiazotropha sp. CDECU1]